MFFLSFFGKAHMRGLWENICIGVQPTSRARFTESAVPPAMDT